MIMRVYSIPLLALLLVGTAACQQQPAQDPGPWGPQPGAYGPGQWNPQGQGQWNPQQPQWNQQPQWGQQGPGLLPPPVFRPVNVPALLALQGRIPCAPKEVAPGTWATFDCAPFQAMTQVMQYIPFVRFK